VSKPITFTRSAPAEFGLLTVKTGRGTRTVPGTDNLKPGDTEWATDEDLHDAGYVPVSEVARLETQVRALLESLTHTEDPFLTLRVRTAAADVRALLLALEQLCAK